MFVYLMFILAIILELIVNEVLKRKESIITEETELIELRSKKDKTYEEQVRYIELNSKYKKYISFSFTDVIKIIILSIVVSFFPKYTIFIFFALVSFGIVKILLSRTQILLNIFRLLLNYTTMFLLFRLISEMNFFLILLTLFVVSFIFNLCKVRFKRRV